MGFSSRQFAPGEKPHHTFSQFSGPNKFNQYFYVRVGVIQEVDIDKYEMTVQWIQGDSGVRDKIPISFAYAGPAGCIGGLPEKGAIGVFGFYNEGGGKGSPLLLALLPAGLDAGLNFNTVKIFPDAVTTTDVNEVDFKFRKLSIGDMIMASPLGSALFLNNSVELHDGIQDSIVIREDDQAIISTSIHNFVFSDGVAISCGPALRNRLPIYDSQGNKIPNAGSILSLSTGKDNIYIVPQGKAITYDTKFYSEYRVDVDELVDGKLDLNDINESSPLSTRSPIVTLAMGNYIGADAKNLQQYGSILKARLFNSAWDSKGSFALEEATQNNGIDEPGILGLAYAMHFLKNGAFVGIDKEGHYYMNLPASTINSLGAGRSMSILAQGNLKEIWGMSAYENNSWSLDTNGGIVWDIGNHNLNRKSRSLEIRTTKGINIRVQGGDDDGFAKKEDLKGNVIQNVTGDKDTICGNLTSTINGLRKENITGSETKSVQSDKTLSVLGVYTENVIKEMTGKYGKRTTQITTGNDELTVMAGNITETMTFGKRSLTIQTTGSIEENLTSGTYKTTVSAGAYTINVKTGTIDIKSNAGLVTISGTAVTIKGNLTVSVDSPIVRLGSGAPLGGAVTGLPGIPSDFCKVTGIPYRGSMKVGIA
jgi:hypothetical protein